MKELKAYKKNQRLGLILVAFSLLNIIFASPIQAATVSQASIWVDNQPIKTSYFMQNGRLMVPDLFFNSVMFLFLFLRRGFFYILTI